MLIAIDFDGTVVEHKYPEIGREIPFAIETLKKLQDDGHKLVMWSVREGKLLQEAVDWCAERGLVFYAVNRNYPEESVEINDHYHRKLSVDMFIDDRNLGGLPDWGTIYTMIKNKMNYRDLVDHYEEDEEAVSRFKKKSFLERMFGK